MKEVPTPLLKPKPLAERTLAFGRSRGKSGPRSLLPPRTRNSQRSRGLASRFQAVIGGKEEVKELETTDSPTTETTTTVPTTTPTSTTTTEVPTTAAAVPFSKRRTQNHGASGRSRSLPFARRNGRRGGFLQKDQNAASSDRSQVLASFLSAAVGNADNHSRTKRMAQFGARSRGRSSLRSSSAQRSDLDTAESAAGEVTDTGSSRRSRLAGRRRQRPSAVKQEEEVPRARAAKPTAAQPTEKQQFTLTPNRSRGRNSGTRRSLPGSRSRRPTSSGSETSATSSGSSSGGAVSLRQRLAARLGATAAKPTPSLPRRGSTRQSSRSPSRSRGSSGSAPRRNRRPNLFASRGGSRSQQNSFNSAQDIDPTPVLPEGSIIVVSEKPTTTSIPVVEGGRTSFKEILQATTVTATLGPNQYTEVEGLDGELRTHVGEKTTVGVAGLTEVTTSFLQPTEIKTAVRTQTKIRGRNSPSYFSYIQPAFTVQPEVRTAAAATSQFPQQQQNNPLALLLMQLLRGQQLNNNGFSTPPLTGRLGGGVQSGPPRQAYRTVTHTTTYVTTLTESALTTVPIFFGGRRTSTVIVNTDVQVITATEVITSSQAIPGQTIAPANNFANGGGLAGLGGLGTGNNFGLNQQQLLLQQLLLQSQQQQQLFQPQQQQQFQPQPQLPQPQPQQPLIRPTREPALLNQQETSSIPPQLEELFRQATEVALEEAARPSTSVETIFVSGSRPGEFFTRLSTVFLDQTDSVQSGGRLSRGRARSRLGRGKRSPSAPVRVLHTELPAVQHRDASEPRNEVSILDHYVMSAMNEIDPGAPDAIGATQTLESARRGVTLRQDALPGVTYVLVQTTGVAGKVQLPSELHQHAALHRGVIA